MRERQISFKGALNQAVRLGIGGLRQKSRRRFRQKTCRMGFRPEFRWGKALALAEAQDDGEPPAVASLAPGR